MKTKSLGLRTLSLLTILFLFSGAVVADDVAFDDFEIQLEDSTVDIGDDIKILLEFKEPDITQANTEMELEIEIDGVQVHYDEDFEVSFEENVDKTVSIKSNNFQDEDEEDLWEGLLMAYDCGEHDVTVTLNGGDLDEDLDGDDSYEIGRSADNFDSITLSMDSPTLEDDLEIKVTDEDGDEYDEGASIRVVWLSDKGDKDDWDPDDDDYSTSTKSDGTKSFALDSKFDDDAYGAYRIDVYDNDPEFCLHTIFFNVSNALKISDPMPLQPKVAVPFRVNITRPDGRPAIGVSVMGSGPGGFIPARRTGADGSVSFTFNSQGSYTLTVGGDGTYDLVTKSIVLSEKPVLSASVSPSTQVSGKTVEIAVKSGGDPVADATVSVGLSGRTPTTLNEKTDSSGKTSYIASDPGDYSVKVTKDGHVDATATFKVQNNFIIDVPSSGSAKKGTEALIKVKDSSGNPVEGTSISVEGRPVVGTTDANGIFKFIITEVGGHTVVASKAGYTTSKATFNVGDELKISLSVNEVEMDGSTTISVTDSLGVSVEARITITKPDKSKVSETSASYSYTPDKVGEHSIQAAKSGYSTASGKLTVTPRPLKLSTSFDGDTLIVKALARGKPVSGLNLVVTGATDAKSTVKTDSSGTATVPAIEVGDYMIKAEDPGYTSTSVSAKKEDSMLSGLLMPAIIVLVLLMFLIIIVILVLHVSRSKKKSTLVPTRGSRLGSP
ncbi:carboxypeptidase regulatory-like domain-containing protein [Candidatus Altiarchaeota archaeon]